MSDKINIFAIRKAAKFFSMFFSEQQLIDKLNEFVKLPTETEWLEFKDANDNFKTDEIGQYFSALCNEANLNKLDFTWLIFGVNKKIMRLMKL